MKRRLLLGLAIVATLVFAALGVWQVERLRWKLDLIAKVEARVYAAPTPPPSWAGLDAKREEYRRVVVRGTYRHDRETLVQALTRHGAGFWVMTPLATPQGIALVNRGFVPPERRDPQTRQPSAGRVTVIGLLRASEPGGGFLRANDPVASRWYSRDVAAIAAARRLGKVAPFFVDADATPNPGGYPIGGLTVVQFRNNHLAYAITWFGLALLSFIAATMIFRDKRAR